MDDVGATVFAGPEDFCSDRFGALVGTTFSVRATSCSAGSSLTMSVCIEDFAAQRRLQGPVDEDVEDAPWRRLVEDAWLSESAASWITAGAAAMRHVVGPCPGFESPEDGVEDDPALFLSSVVEDRSKEGLPFSLSSSRDS